MVPDKIDVSRNRRKRLYIRSKLQLRYVAVFLAIMVVGAIAGFLLPRLDSLMTSSIGVFRLVSVALVFLIVGGTVLIALFLTNKIAGPIYRLQLFLEDARQEKDLSHRIRFRHNDEMHEIADGLNKLLDDVWKDICYTQVRLDRAIPRVDRAFTMVSSSQDPRSKEVSDELEEALKFLLEARSTYRPKTDGENQENAQDQAHGT